MRSSFFFLLVTGCAGGGALDGDASMRAEDSAIPLADSALSPDSSSPADASSNEPALRVAQVVAGESHVCVRFEDGKVCCAGMGRYLGARGTASSSVLVDVPGLESGVTLLSSSPMHTCAIKSDGSVWCWGDETNYALGDGVTTASEGSYAMGAGPVRAAIASASPARDIGTGSWSSCARLEDGTTYCWGRQDADLGDGGRYYQTPTAVVALGTEGRQLSGGWGLRCAVRANGQVSCWGHASTGAGTVDYPVPATVAGLESITQIAVGGNHACALRSDGHVSCFGNGNQGALGQGSDTSTSTPQPVAGLEGVVQIAAGGTHVCARTSDGSIHCWGGNSYAELGRSTSLAQSNVPLRVEGLPPAIDVSASFGTTCARLEAGELYCWGRVGMIFGEESGSGERDAPPVDAPRAIPSSLTCEAPTLI